MKILFYDIETSPLRAWIWKLGKQYVRHGQLDAKYNSYNIICITYCWNDGKPAKALHWNIQTHSCKEMIRKFDKIIATSDFTLGKNSDRFDVKHINTQRALKGLPGMPEWAMYTEDLEKQVRKHFYFPSNSLDYISLQMGQGGKHKMEMQDWIDIVENNSNAEEKLQKMISYGLKDVEDTRALWDQLSPHLTPRWNHAILNDKELMCKSCGSTDISKNGTRHLGRTNWQSYYCNSHGGYAGRVAMKSRREVLL